MISLAGSESERPFRNDIILENDDASHVIVELGRDVKMGYGIQHNLIFVHGFTNGKDLKIIVDYDGWIQYDKQRRFDE